VDCWTATARGQSAASDSLTGSRNIVHNAPPRRCHVYCQPALVQQYSSLQEGRHAQRPEIMTARDPLRPSTTATVQPYTRPSAVQGPGPSAVGWACTILIVDADSSSFTEERVRGVRWKGGAHTRRAAYLRSTAAAIGTRRAAPRQRVRAVPTPRIEQASSST
jgi:hypothetical protein